MTGFGGTGQARAHGVPEGRGRLGYLDWARGLAVLAMLQTHGFNAWTVADDRDTSMFGVARVIGGFPAPLFLFLAGVAAALVAERERAQGQGGAEVLRRGGRRALTVLGYAFVFRLGMWVSGGFGRPADLLRVDVLNCIAVSLGIVTVGLAARTTAGRTSVLLAAALAVAFATPVVWDGAWWTGWPPAIAGYATGRLPDSVFPIFPWSAYALLGAACGVILAAARARGGEARAVATVAACGAAAVPVALLADAHGPALYARYDFWYTSPAYVAVKAGIVLVVLGLAYLADMLPGPSALRPLGRASLLVYWVHLEIVYGRWIAPGARGSLLVEEAGWGVAALALAMLALAVARASARGGGPAARPFAQA